MNNMLATIVPKSDQLNADSFIGGESKTIKITSVTIKPGDQPTTIFYEGDNGRPYKPGKSMARVLVHCWGADANQYIGRSMTLYADPTVIFGGAKVGGIRISHLSDISQPITMMLTNTKASRKPFTVKPLVAESVPSFEDCLAGITAADSLETLGTKFKEAQRLFKDETQRAELVKAKDARKAELTQPTTGETTNG